MNSYYNYTEGCGCYNKDVDGFSRPYETTCIGDSRMLMPPPPIDYPYPPYPPYPYPYPVPKCNCNSESEETITKKSIEAQICELSKKSAVISKMIKNYEEKKRNAIIKIGEYSYNFGGYYGEDDKPTETGDAILEILKKEASKIKEEIAELVQKLDSDI